MNQPIVISIHDATPDLYQALAVAELESDGTRWKVLETPTTRLVVFAPREN